MLIQFFQQTPDRLCFPMSRKFCRIQSTPDAAVSRGPLLCSQSEQSLKSRHRLVTPIMAKNELIEVNLELRTADAVVGANQPLLDVPIARSAKGTTDLTPLRNSVVLGCARAMCRYPTLSKPVKLFRASV